MALQLIKGCALQNLKANPKVMSSSRSFAKIRERFHKNIKEKQRMFQVDDDVPVYLKGGLADKMLAQFTIILAVSTAAYSLYTGIDMAFRKK